MTISIENFTLYRQDKLIIEQLTHRFDSGKWHLTGPNGCGKSSLLMAITQQIRYQGRCQIHGIDDQQGDEYKRQYGFCADKLHYFPFATAQQYLQHHLDAFELAELPSDLLSLFEQFNLAAQLDKKISELSLGNCKKLSIICALLSPGNWLIMDEPFNGLDKASSGAFAQWLSASDKSMLITNHSDFDVAELRPVDLHSL